MYTEDFILRQINIAVAILRQLLRLKAAGQHQEALQAVDQALETLLGLRASLLEQLEDGKVISMLDMPNGLDTERLALIAELYKEAGEIHKQEGRAAQSQAADRRALRFYLELSLADPKLLDAGLMGKVSTLQASQPLAELPLETQMALLDYLEGLRGKTDGELEGGGTSRSALEAAILSLKESLYDELD
jgi:tetratricopeptide (TPR) repeat protein